MIGLLAFLCCAVKPGEIAIPLDYYTADEVAQRISQGGVKYVASTDLDTDVYLLSLPSAPVGQQIERLEQGLHWAVPDSGTVRKIKTDPAYEKEQTRLRTIVVENLIKQEETNRKVVIALFTGEIPSWFSSIPRQTLDQMQFQVNQSRQVSRSRAAIRILQDAAPPTADQFKDMVETSDFYPWAALSPDIVSDLDSTIETPPLVGIMFGYRIIATDMGPVLTPHVLPVTNGDRQLSLPMTVVDTLPWRTTRSRIVDTYLRGISDPVWKMDGIPKKDLELLDKRAAATKEALSSLSEVTAPEANSELSFSTDLAYLAKAGKIGVIYRLNSHDEQVPIPTTMQHVFSTALESLFPKDSGYTATFENGVLMVTDELSFFPTADVIPEAALVETLHKKLPGKSLFDEIDGLYPLTVDDLDEFQGHCATISGRTGWPIGNFRLPLNLSFAEINLLRGSAYLVPTLRALSEDEQQALARGESIDIRELDAFNDPDVFAAMVNGPAAVYFKTEDELLLRNARVTRVRCHLMKSGDEYVLSVAVDIRNPRGALVWGIKGDFPLSHTDPYLKHLAELVKN